MKLIRLVHENIAHNLVKNPSWGCMSFNGFPFFYGYDNIATALLEHPTFAALGKLPPTIRAIEYLLPDESIQFIKDSSLYGEYSQGNNYLANWVNRFLSNNSALVAIYPSKHWAHLYNYIVNPRHELFLNVSVTPKKKIYR